MRVRNLIELARPVGDALLERFAEIARQEQLLAVRMALSPTRTRNGLHQQSPGHGVTLGWA
jgi:hypothetical protein